MGHARRLAAALLASAGVVLAANATAADAAPSRAGEVGLRAMGRGRVALHLAPSLRSDRLRVTLDGRPVRVARRPARFSLPDLAGSTAWHRLVVRGRKATAATRFAIGAHDGADAPTLVLSAAPERRTASRRASFAYSASGGTVTCTLDGTPVACSSRRATAIVAPGRHTARVRARKGGGSASLSWTWSVTGDAAADPKAAAPASALQSPAPTLPDRPAAWRLMLADDFDGSSLDMSTWLPYGPNWPGHDGNGIRDGSAISVGGGMLTITAQMRSGSLVSGAIASYLNFAYGRVEFRVRTDADPSQATSGVVLLWPQDDRDWPSAGEYDIYETGTRPDRATFDSFVHYGADNRQHWLGHPADATAWHDMAMDWTPDGISIYRDGVLAGTIDDPQAISASPHHVCVQLDAFRTLMGSPVRMQVDHLRVYGSGG